MPSLQPLQYYVLLTLLCSDNMVCLFCQVKSKELSLDGNFDCPVGDDKLLCADRKKICRIDDFRYNNIKSGDVTLF